MSKDIEQYFSDNPESLKSFSKLNQALKDISLQMLEDRDFLADAFKQIQKMKREFGRGFLFLNLGQFNIEGNKITAPEAEQLDTVWLDEDTTRSNFKKHIADEIIPLLSL